MRDSELGRLENRIYSRSINPLIRHAVFDGEIVGFDTEYVSGTRKLLSFQLWHGERGAFHPCSKLTPAKLVDACESLIGTRPARIMLVAYFSLAELQFLDVAHGAIERKEYAKGSLDVTFVVGDGPAVELQVVDVWRWYDGQSLANAAKAMGYEKKEWDTKHVKESDLKSARFKEYAIHDAYLAQAIYKDLRAKFMESGVDIATAHTAPSASASVFRLKYVKRKLYCDSNEARLLACKGTWGGRAEVFRRGRLNGTFYEYDLKSAYPNAAVGLRFMPVQRSWTNCRSIASVGSCRGGFGRFGFRFPMGTRYPCLPVSAKSEAMVYPLEGETSCTFAEVEVARRMGASIRILDAYGYSKGTPILAEYMAECLTERANSTGAGRVLWKLLANSIIGKFAQRAEGFSIQKLYELAEATDSTIEDLADMSNAERKILADEAGIKMDTFSLGPIWMPEWNGLITGYTRARLSEAIAKGEAVYAHTDSIWSPKKGLRLGDGWELKASGPCTVARTRLAMLGKGDDAHVAHHSVWSRKVATQMLGKFTGVTDVTRTYPKTRPIKMKESIRMGRNVGEWIGPGDPGYWHRASTKWDGKRELLPGGETRPWPNVDAYQAWVDKNYR